MDEFEVLIVDDDPTVLFLHAVAVKKSGLSLSPVTLEGGKALIDLLDTATTTAHYLVLLDINMPDMKGWEVMDVIQRKSYAQRVSFVIVSSSVDRADHERAKTYRDVIDFIEKPLSRDALEAIGSRLQRGLSAGNFRAV